MIFPFPNISELVSLFECPTHHFFHIYCPGCGLTRSVTAILRGDLALSLFYNPIALLAILGALLACVTYGLERAGAVPVENARKARSYIAWLLLIIWLVYFAVRNIALLVFGFDWIGDFS